ncbi:hypothetical protein D3C84_673190 [compost metagenome]
MAGLGEQPLIVETGERMLRHLDDPRAAQGTLIAVAMDLLLQASQALQLSAAALILPGIRPGHPRRWLAEGMVGRAIAGIRRATVAGIP